MENKTLLLIFGALLLIAIIVFLSVGKLKTESFQMDQTEAEYLEALENAFTPAEWTVEGESVFIDDKHAYISATPHTGVGWITFNVTSKQYDGDIDLVFGFDTTQIKPTKARYNPRYVTKNQSYTCEHEFNYTLEPKHFWCYEEYDFGNGTAGTTVFFDHDFDYGNIQTKTAKWEYITTEWTDVSSYFTKRDLNLFNLTTWYYTQGVDVDPNESLIFQVFIQPQSYTPKSKYWFAIKPSGETIEEAIENEHFYALDPWTPDLDTNLVAYYKLDATSGVVVDDLGNYNGTNLGATRGATGKINNAFSFSPNEDVDINEPLLGAANAVTVNAWVKSPYSSTDDKAIFAQFQTGNAGRTIMAMQNGDIIFQVGDQNVLTDDGYPDDVWYMVTFVRLANNTAYIYINGEVNKTGTISNNIAQVDSYLGSLNHVTFWMDGEIDEVGVWNGTALNSSEISTLYNSGSGITRTTLSLNITYPVNGTTYNVPVSDLNYTVTGGERCWYSSDGGTTNSSDVAAGTNFTISPVAKWNNYTVYCNTTGSTEFYNTTTFYANLSVSTELVNPPNETEISTPYYEFEWNSTPSNTNVTNTTLYIWNSNGTLFASNFSDIADSDTVVENSYNQTTIPDGTYLWNAESCGNDVVCAFATTNRTFYLDTTAPNITIHSPNETFNFLNQSYSLLLNWTATEAGTVDNCSYTYNGVTNNINSTWCLGESYFYIPYVKGQNYVSMFINDTFGNSDEDNATFGYLIYENDFSYTSSVSGTSSQLFEVNVTTNGTAISSATFYYDGASQSADVTLVGADYIINTTKVVPSAAGSYDVYFTLDIGGIEVNSTIHQQTVTGIVFTLCNGTYDDPFLNFTFKDESDDSIINATNPLTDVYYQISGASGSQQYYTTSNASENWNYSFCFEPSSENVTIDLTFKYEKTDYPLRTFTYTNKELSNTTTTKVLYLLPTAEGIYVTLSVINSAENPLEDVNVVVSRVISGSLETIGQGTTDVSGSITFWLNPNFQHYFNFTKSGYNNYNAVFTPTQTGYTITMPGGSTQNESYYKGIDILVLPENVSFDNDTDYDFGFQLNSSYWNVTEYGFNLRLLNGTIITGGSTAVEGTLLSETYNTGNQSRIYLDYYWAINGTFTNGTVSWNVYNTLNTQWSIKSFFTDFNLYADSGIFGLDNFGRNILIFLVLFLTVGFLTYKFGVRSEVFVAAIVFGVIAFFDFAVGIIPDATNLAGGTVKHLYTTLAGILLAITIFRGLDG